MKDSIVGDMSAPCSGNRGGGIDVRGRLRIAVQIRELRADAMRQPGIPLVVLDGLDSPRQRVRVGHDDGALLAAGYTRVEEIPVVHMHVRLVSNDEDRKSVGWGKSVSERVN